MKKPKLWLKGAIKRVGALRKRMQQLHLVNGTARIPLRALRRAAKGEFGPKTKKRATLALTMRGFKKKRT